MRNPLLLFIAIFFASFVFAGDVPVVEATTFEPIPRDGIHRVMQGETFYSIAWRYGLNYKKLAAENHLKPPYTIEIGEKIYLPGFAPKNNPSIVPPSPVPVMASVQAPVPVQALAPQPPSVKAHLKHLFTQFNNEPMGKVWPWRWPAHGRVIGGYSTFNKGINISGRRGDPVYAAAGGKVVYNGNGLRTYGNLIIIKHNSTYLTAYAHNTKTLVYQGEWVKAGQKIAEMGDTGTNRVMLHFEIRKEGAPVNPIRYLSSR